MSSMPPRRTLPLLEHLESRSIRVGDCLIWTGATIRGYGSINVGGRTRTTHRMAWIERHGEPPASKPLVLHRCDTPLCLADDHLFVGTVADNNRDRNAKGRNPNSVKTRCKYGHPYDEANTYITPSNGYRKCRACHRRRVLMAYHRDQPSHPSG